MSLSEYTKLEKQTFKPFLKYDIGQVVYLNSDIGRKTPLLIVNFELDEDECNDYVCQWMNVLGKSEADTFPEECLTI